MLARHPYRAVGVLLGVFAVATFLGGMIGQFNDGPWGGLPAWLGTASYAISMLSALALIVLTVYLVVANLRYRKATR